MAGGADDRPVLVVDGDRFDDFEGFTREFSRLLDGWEWSGNLDAFDDILRGGFGTPDGGWTLRWIHSERSRTVLGYAETVRWLEASLERVHPSNVEVVRAAAEAAGRHEGPTLFDTILAVLRDHGPGGDQAEDGVLLELM